MTSSVRPDRAIRTWGDWETAKREKNYTKAEEKLVAHCLDGKSCPVGNGELPEELKTENQVNADLLRYLIIGGCKNCDLHEWGVVVAGAYITGVLDLRLVKAVGVTGMINCHFEEPIEAMNARLESMNLSGSYCVGVNLQGATVNGDVSLSDGFSSKGEVSLSGAVLGGQLNCEGGSFDSSTDYTLNAQNSKMSAFIWRGVKDCQGDLSLVGAKASVLADDASSWSLVKQAALDGFTYDTIRGPLDEKSRLQWLLKARAYDGSFSPQPYEQLADVFKRMGYGSQCRIILVEKEKRLGRFVRGVYLERRRLGSFFSSAIKQNGDSKPNSTDQFLRNVRTNSEAYASALRDRFDEYKFPSLAQEDDLAYPYVIERNRSEFRRGVFWVNLSLALLVAWLHIKDWFLWLLIGYGYRPWNAFWSLFILLGIAWTVAHLAYYEGQFAPNSDLILSTEEWQTIAASDSDNPAEEWSETTVTGRDYESFSAFAYAIDVVIPVVAIGQEAAWAPSKTRGVWGHTLWWLRWALTGAGWIVTALGAAAITGLIRRD